MYRGRIISTDDRDSTDLLAEFEKWLSSEPVVIARGEVLKLVKNPITEMTTQMTTELKETPSIKPLEQNETEASQDDIPMPIIGGIAGVAAVFVLLIVVVIVTALVLRKRRYSIIVQTVKVYICKG